MKPLRELPARYAESVTGNVQAQFRMEICLFLQSPARCLAHTRPTKQWVFVAVNNVDVNKYVMVSVVTHMWKILY